MSTGIWATEICPEDNASISEGLAWKHRMSEVLDPSGEEIYRKPRASHPVWKAAKLGEG